MFDVQDDVVGFDDGQFDMQFDRIDQAGLSWAKILFDMLVASALFPLLLAVGAVLLLMNPFLNAGPLLFFQRRMGQGLQPFTAIKFRTMRPDPGVTRGAFDALEATRISPLGRFLRKTRIDELPQIINVLRGEMSLIGPRPDSYDHACVYIDTVPGYAQRCRAMPGISGFAQTEVGYVDGLEGLQRKVAADLHYIANASFGFDLWITWRTFCVILGRKGS